MFFQNARHGSLHCGKASGARAFGRRSTALLLGGLLTVALTPAVAQEHGNRQRLDIHKYTINADLNPATHKLHARTEIDFVPQDDLLNINFELNNNLAPSKITDGRGDMLTSQRNQSEGTLRVNFERPLPKGQPAKLDMEYDGVLASGENQPVEGLKLAYVGDEVSYLLYPGRWIPVAGYRTDRFSADMNITVPAGLRVVAPGSGDMGRPAAAGQTTYSFKYTRSDFPASLAVVKGQPQHVATGGFPVDIYFRGTETAQAATYGEAVGKIVTFFTSKFGPAPVTSVSLVETDSGTVNAYAAPGIVFLAPRAIGTRLNYRLLAHELSHLWWRTSVSPATPADLWLDEGLATYSEMLYVEQVAGKAALETLAHDVGVQALSNDSVAIARSASLEEYSPQYDSVLSKKGGMVLQMLRWVVGDDKFFTALRNFAAAYQYKPATTDDLRKTFEAVSGKNLQGFFIQWVESTGAPEFKADYTIYRTQKGFKIVGKIKQDMDTFSMPVEVKIETDGEPELKRIDVVGTASDFQVETYGRPRKVIVDPENHVLKYSDKVRQEVSINKGQQYADGGDYENALKEYQKALDINKNSSLAHFRIGEVFFAQNNYQSAANAFRESLNGDGEPRWTEVWSHINLGKIFDITGQRDRATNEYNQAIRTRDDTQGAQTEAQKYIKEPYKRERVSEGE